LAAATPDTVCFAPGSWEEEQRRTLRRLAFAVLAVGLCWRFIRYLLRFPIWGDEAMLCVNFLDHDYLGLTRELHNCQIAPVLFLWGEEAVLRWLGSSELAMRLPLFLAGLASLALFWRLARLTLSPLGHTLAVGILAVSVWPVSMGVLVKPYALDLLTSLVLLTLAMQWLARPQKLLWLVLLTTAVPFALLASYPSVFIAGSVSLMLLPAVCRRPGWSARTLYVAYNLILLATFSANYLLIGLRHLDSTVGAATTRVGMETYWAEGFPPQGLLPLVKWLVLIHTGQMSAYPVGSSDGGSVLTVLLSLVGVCHFWRGRRWPLVLACTAPLALGMIAAVLRRYPYGASGRLMQHVAPPIILSAAAGAAVLIRRARTDLARGRWTVAICGLFVLIGIAGTIRDVIQPYRDERDCWLRRVVQDVWERVPPSEPIVMLNEPEAVDFVARWYLTRQHGRVIGRHAEEFGDIERRAEHLWFLHYGPAATASCCWESGTPPGTWTLSETFFWTREPKRPGEPSTHFALYLWAHRPEEKQALRGGNRQWAW
jgi:hypothetical protein